MLYVHSHPRPVEPCMNEVKSAIDSKVAHVIVKALEYKRTEFIREKKLV